MASNIAFSPKEWEVAVQGETTAGTAIDVTNQVDTANSTTGNTITKIDDDFYKIYANSDFMKYFDLVKTDYKDVVDPSTITLKCNALIKFLPFFMYVNPENKIYHIKKDLIELNNNKNKMSY